MEAEVDIKEEQELPNPDEKDPLACPEQSVMLAELPMHFLLESSQVKVENEVLMEQSYDFFTQQDDNIHGENMQIKEEYIKEEVVDESYNLNDPKEASPDFVPFEVIDRIKEEISAADCELYSQEEMNQSLDHQLYITTLEKQALRTSTTPKRKKPTVIRRQTSLHKNLNLAQKVNVDKQRKFLISCHRCGFNASVNESSKQCRKCGAKKSEIIFEKRRYNVNQVDFNRKGQQAIKGQQTITGQQMIKTKSHVNVGNTLNNKVLIGQKYCMMPKISSVFSMAPINNNVVNLFSGPVILQSHQNPASVNINLNNTISILPNSSCFNNFQQQKNLYPNQKELLTPNKHTASSGTISHSLNGVPNRNIVKNPPDVCLNPASTDCKLLTTKQQYSTVSQTKQKTVLSNYFANISNVKPTGSSGTIIQTINNGVPNRNIVKYTPDVCLNPTLSDCKLLKTKKNYSDILQTEQKTVFTNYFGKIPNANLAIKRSLETQEIPDCKRIKMGDKEYVIVPVFVPVTKSTPKESKTLIVEKQKPAETVSPKILHKQNKSADVSQKIASENCKNTGVLDSIESSLKTEKLQHFSSKPVYDQATMASNKEKTPESQINEQFKKSKINKATQSVAVENKKHDISTENESEKSGINTTTDGGEQVFTAQKIIEKKQCCFCNVYLKTKNDLIEHVLGKCKNFSESEIIQCKRCDRDNSQPNKKCDFNCASKCKVRGCTFTTWVKKLMVLHEITAEHTFKCKICKMKTSDEQKYIIHRSNKECKKITSNSYREMKGKLETTKCGNNVPQENKANNKEKLKEDPVNSKDNNLSKTNNYKFRYLMQCRICYLITENPQKLLRCPRCKSARYGRLLRKIGPNQRPYTTVMKIIKPKKKISISTSNVKNYAKTKTSVVPQASPPNSSTGPANPSQQANLESKDNHNKDLNLAKPNNQPLDILEKDLNKCRHCNFISKWTKVLIRCPSCSFMHNDRTRYVIQFFNQKNGNVLGNMDSNNKNDTIKQGVKCSKVTKALSSDFKSVNKKVFENSNKKNDKMKQGVKCSKVTKASSSDFKSINKKVFEKYYESNKSIQNLRNHLKKNFNLQTPHNDKILNKTKVDRNVNKIEYIFEEENGKSFNHTNSVTHLQNEINVNKSLNQNITTKLGPENAPDLMNKSSNLSKKMSEQTNVLKSTKHDLNTEKNMTSEQIENKIEFIYEDGNDLETGDALDLLNEELSETYEHRHKTAKVTTDETNKLIKVNDSEKKENSETNKNINNNICKHCGKSRNCQYFAKCRSCGYLERESMLTKLRKTLYKEVRGRIKKNLCYFPSQLQLTGDTLKKVNDVIDSVINGNISSDIEASLFQPDIYEIFEELDIDNRTLEDLKIKTCTKCGYFSIAPLFECFICGFVHLERTVLIKLWKYRTAKSLTCYYCLFKATNRSQFVKHVLTKCKNVIKSDIIICFSCGTSNIAGMVEKKCPNCPRICNVEGCTFATWIRPLMMWHKKTMMHQFDCERCDFTTGDQYLYKKHQLIEDLKCIKCFWQAENEQDLLTHVRTCVSKESVDAGHQRNQQLILKNLTKLNNKQRMLKRITKKPFKTQSQPSTSQEHLEKKIEMNPVDKLNSIKIQELTLQTLQPLDIESELSESQNYPAKNKKIEPSGPMKSIENDSADTEINISKKPEVSKKQEFEPSTSKEYQNENITGNSNHSQLNSADIKIKTQGKANNLEVNEENSALKIFISEKGVLKPAFIMKSDKDKFETEKFKIKVALLPSKDFMKKSITFSEMCNNHDQTDNAVNGKAKIFIEDFQISVSVNVRWTKEEGAKYHCPQCKFQCYDMLIMKKHQTESHIPMFYRNIVQMHCDFCPYLCLSEESIKSHVRNLHQVFDGGYYTYSSSRLKCMSCSFETDWFSKMKTHCITEHSDGTNDDFIHFLHYKKMPGLFVCNVCPTPVSIYDKHLKSIVFHCLSNHNKFVNFLSFNCRLCSFETSNLSIMNNHYKVHKNAFVSYKCLKHTCTFQTVDSDDFQVHQFVHHMENLLKSD